VKASVMLEETGPAVRGRTARRWRCSNRPRFAGKDYQDKRPRDRYVSESRSLLDVLEARLATRTWIMGDDFTITDIGTFPMIRNLVGYYRANANHSYKRGSRKIQDEARGRNYFRRTAFGIRQVAAAMHKE
jgi:glutathione S-transferase